MQSVPSVPSVSSEVPGSREKILDVAEALFARSGYAGVGLREVASQVGLGKSSLFHHFRTKQQLYHEVLLRVVERIRICMAPALRVSAEPVQRLELCADAIVDALAEHPTVARLLLRALFEDDVFPAPSEATPESEALDASLAETIGGFQQLVQNGIESGDFRDVSIPEATQAFVGAAVFHFASGEFGESLVGGSLFSAEAVARWRRELKSFLHFALISDSARARSVQRA